MNIFEKAISKDFVSYIYFLTTPSGKVLLIVQNNMFEALISAKRVTVVILRELESA